MINFNKTEILILAAGRGKRMKSTLPKVLVPLNGKPMIFYLLELVHALGVKEVIVIIGYMKDMVRDAISNWSKDHPSLKITFAIQDEQNGTGHAVLNSKSSIRNLHNNLIVMLGDVPLVKKETLIDSITLMQNSPQLGAIILTTELTNPKGYGRILKNSNGSIIAIREEKDASVSEQLINEINTGIFLFNGFYLWEYISNINSNNTENEFYLTDIVSLFHKNNIPILAHKCSDSYQFMGANSQEQLAELEKNLNK